MSRKTECNPIFRNSKQGQTSVEFLMLLAVALLIVMLVSVLAQGQLNTIKNVKDEADTRNSLLDLSSAAREVYAQGEGSKKLVFVQLPSSYEPAYSNVSNKSIRMRAAGTDYVSLENFNVHGYLPSASGGHWVWVVSEGTAVRIGSAMLELNPNLIHVTMNQNSTATDSFSVKNIWGSDVNVTVTSSWSNTAVSMNGFPLAFTLVPQQTNNIDLNFVSTADAVGFYTGTIQLSAIDGPGSTDTVILPVAVEVIGSGIGQSPPLTVIPSLWNETMLANTTATKSFMVCTNSGTALTSINFTPSPGAPASWVGGLTALGALDKNSCQPKILNLTVPYGTSPAVYSGYIQVNGQGADGATDTITVTITVGGDPTDIIGPNVTSTIYIPNKIYSNTPVTFYVTGSDAGRGNNLIKSCEISTDFITWKQMSPSDGTFDEMTENAYYVDSTGYALGNHNIQFRCTDSRDNVGPTASISIKVMKNFLFATKTSSPSSTETDWMTWLSTHESDMGFNWEYDWTSDNNLADGLVDSSYYSVIVLADYQNNNNVIPELTEFIEDGGRVIFLGTAFQQGLRDAGLTTSPGSSGSTSVYIVTNNHYTTGSFSTNQTVAYTVGSSHAIKNFIGTKLATRDSTKTEVMLGESGGYVVWGALAAGLNSNGTIISTNAFDYSLLQSSITPG